MSDVPTEDRLAMARRHVKQGEHHVARQKALIAELDRDGYAKLAVEARALLTTFETSLLLMHEDLARIENESRGSGDPDCFEPASFGNSHATKGTVPSR
jgi:hypothetical protein